MCNKNEDGKEVRIRWIVRGGHLFRVSETDDTLKIESPLAVLSESSAKLIDGIEDGTYRPPLNHEKRECVVEGFDQLIFQLIDLRNSFAEGLSAEIPLLGICFLDKDVFPCSD